MIRETYGAGNTIVLEYCCDFCHHCTTHNKRSTGITPIMECAACGRHVCSGHRLWYEWPLFLGRRVYCLECWDIGKKYRDRVIHLRGKAREHEKDLRLAWHNEGREGKRLKRVEVAKGKGEAVMNHG